MLFTVTVALSSLEFILSSLFITPVKECKLLNSSSLFIKSRSELLSDLMLASLAEILFKILVASSLPLSNALFKSDVSDEVDDDISTIRFKSVLISGAILFTLLLVSCKK